MRPILEQSQGTFFLSFRTVSEVALHLPLSMVAQLVPTKPWTNRIYEDQEVSQAVLSTCEGESSQSDFLGSSRNIDHKGQISGGYRFIRENSINLIDPMNPIDSINLIDSINSINQGKSEKCSKTLVS